MHLRDAASGKQEVQHVQVDVTHTHNDVMKCVIQECSSSLSMHT